jgi:tRNA (cmo5U34)-methyltransferase
MNMEKWLEEMSSFFRKRVDGYDDHMLTEVDGVKEAYKQIAKHIPVKQGLRLVDLGCGTGLELEEIFRINPSVKVTGIDLTREMLDKLVGKYPDKDMTLYNMSYFDFDFGTEQYDTAVSCETLHHFTHEEKTGLYTRLCRGLVADGIYVECDYMAPDQEYEDFYFAENKRFREEHGITEGFYHYDTPCTAENQIKMLTATGFSKAEKVWNIEGTVILVCQK